MVARTNSTTHHTITKEGQAMSNTTAVKRTTTLAGTAAKNLIPGDVIDYWGNTYRVISKAISTDHGNSFRDIELQNIETGEQTTITMPSGHRFTTIEAPAEEVEEVEARNITEGDTIETATIFAAEVSDSQNLSQSLYGWNIEAPATVEAISTAETIDGWTEVHIAIGDTMTTAIYMLATATVHTIKA